MTFNVALEVFAVMLALIGIGLMSFVAHYARPPELDAADASNLAVRTVVPAAPRRGGASLSEGAFTVLVLLALLAVTYLLMVGI
ncbi:hypothetical protein [Paraburkholderia acidisoli]|uniref:Uncharacterized protein n=1 Tax=Paraburkholderia acidisoli TaxID=2571748 RepID=A0A7Z2GG10_9BURK|nr:hypothetical protein [Paraburkholderia acidisoli]QGZ61095.1 hypothetical protein FAZ98_04740 [Paraburkholderia acidisoli]